MSHGDSSRREDNSIIKRRTVLKSAGALTIAGFAGCSGDDGGGDDGGSGDDGSTDDGSGDDGSMDDDGSTSNGDGGTIKIGVLIGSSGPYSYLAGVSNPAINMAVEEANSSDEVLPDTTLELARYDTTGDPSEAQAGARELFQREDVDHFLGPVVAPTVNPVRNYIKSIDATMTTMLASAPFLTQDENCTPKLFRPGVTTQASMQPSGQWPTENLGNRGYVLTPDSNLGSAFEANIVAGAESVGGEIVGTASKAPGSTDYSSVLDDIQSNDPDWLFMGMVGEGGLPFLSQAAQIGFQIPMVVGLGEASLGQLQPEQFESIGPMYRTTIWNSSWDTEGNDDFVSSYNDQAGRSPSSTAASVFVSVEAQIRMLDAAGGADASVDEVISAGESLSYDTITGPMEIRDCDHQGTGRIAVSQVTEVGGGNISIERRQAYESTEFYPSCDDIACQL